MEILFTILAFLLLGGGILGAVLPIIPGPPLGFAGLLVLHFGGLGDFSTGFLWLFGGITLAVTAGDYILPSLFTKKFGGSRWASFGSFFGLLLGLIFFPPFGMILGSFLGAFIGELIHRREYNAKALKAALGSLLAFLVGTGAKLIFGGIMLFYAIRAVF
jgi:uncharacterized protein YqgC (DUF456 family)